MKKLMVVALAVGVLAAPALASIKDSKHDLSVHSTATIKSDYDELCIFCHTPHQASTTVSNAPLWNRNTDGGVSSFTTADLYDSQSLTPASKPDAAGLLDAIKNSDVPLCLSCHDGTGMASGIIHKGAEAAPPVFTGGDGGNDQIGGRANLKDGGNVLKDDHPIGMVYDDVVTAKSDDFNAVVDGVIPGPGGRDLPLFGGRMWCASCHAVHGVPGVDSFLRASNEQSGLCLACHNK
ncbi:cytochrome c3 family protein [Geoalkalibacter halelectricus]|uniref:cytochrome c3 family protein n=1 Tax=Geoalkalibacter halelectricus TaxID=2847045 RepID=UPI00266FA57E|nr:cytochrome c3 family protein [Geoalkalibacter halelectricus]MDO3378801.1 hypothetical protein [Geoalkalibacter halelectricus]